MTLDEAHLILNMKRGDSMEQILQVRSVLNWEDRSPKILTQLSLEL